VGKQVRPSIIALLASVLFVLSAVVGIVAALPDGSTVSDEATASNEELADPEKLVPPETLSIVEFTRHMYNYGYNVGTRASNNVTYNRSFDSNLESDALEYQTLLASLSPGVRANYRAWLLDRADAREKQRERDEAEYAAFIKDHLRRVNEDRRSKK
jgi:hypothetical protein